jgi:hypothetical protein
MLIELPLERLLRVDELFYSGQRNLELLIAQGADCDSGDGREPFEHSKSLLFHGKSFSRDPENDCGSSQLGNRKADDSTFG